MSPFKFKLFCAGLAFALLLGAIAALAQGPGPGFTPPPPPPTQGFESNIQLPAN